MAKTYTITKPDGRANVVRLDNLAIELLPLQAQGGMAGYINTSIVILWREIHPDLYPLNLGAMIERLAFEFGQSEASIVRCATVWHAALDKKSKGVPDVN